MSSYQSLLNEEIGTFDTIQITEGAQTDYILQCIDDDGNTKWSSLASFGVSSLQGTQNQVLVSGTYGTQEVGDLILTLPQDIATTSNVQFADCKSTTFTIGTTSLNSTNFSYLQPINQQLTTTSSPTFVNTTSNLTGNVLGNLTGQVLTATQSSITTLPALTSIQGQALPSSVWQYVATMNQNVSTSGSPFFFGTMGVNNVGSGLKLSWIYMGTTNSLSGDGMYMRTDSLAGNVKDWQLTNNFNGTNVPILYMNTSSQLSIGTQSNPNSRLCYVGGTFEASGLIYGTLGTASQPNITTLGTLTGLTMGGTLAMGSNAITSSGNVGGTLTTVSQPNITTLAGLTSIQGQSLSSSVWPYVSTMNQNVSTSSSPTFSNITITNTMASNNVDTGAIACTTLSGTSATLNSIRLITGATNNYVLKSDASGNASWSALSSLGVSSLTGTANQVLVNGTSGSAMTGAITLTLPQSIGTSSNVTFNQITGTLQTAAQTNITSVGSLTGLRVNGGVGINIAAVSTYYQTISIDNTNFNGLYVGGSSTDTTAAVHSGIKTDVQYKPTNTNSNYYLATYVAPTFTSSTSQTLSGVLSSLYISDIFTGNAGTLSTVAGIYYDGGGSLPGGTITYHYGGYFATPLAGTNKFALYTADLAVGNNTVPPTNGIYVHGPAKFNNITDNTNGNLTAGTYTPTYTCTLGGSTISSSITCKYMRIGTQVHVCGRCQVIPGSSSSGYTWTMTLPFSRTNGNFSNGDQAAGACTQSGTGASYTAQVVSTTGAQTLSVVCSFISSTSATAAFDFSFMYEN